MAISEASRGGRPTNSGDSNLWIKISTLLSENILNFPRKDASMISRGQLVKKEAASVRDLNDITIEILLNLGIS